MSEIVIGRLMVEPDTALSRESPWMLGKKVAFDTDLLLASRLLITADSGGGKSWLARVLFEQTFGKVQQIIIDPEGEFASLREKFPFVLVGKGGDTPADVRSAAMLAHRLLKLRVSAICDLYELKPADRQLWAKSFFEALIEAPKELRTPLVLSVDEFQMFAPESGFGVSVALDASIDVATRGRKRGICLAGITQRLAQLNKNVTSQLQNRLIGAQFEEVNVVTAAKLFGIPPGAPMREFRENMQLLEPGQFYAFGRAISRERVLIKVGDVQTSHPKAFEKHTAPPPPTPEKVKKLLPQLADLPQEAEKKAQTEAEYKKQIRELQKQLSAVSRQPSAQPAPVTVTKADPQQARVIRELRALLEEAMKISAKINAIGFDGAEVKPEEIQAAVEKAAAEVGRLAAGKLTSRRRELENLKAEINRLLTKLNSKLGDDKLTIAVDVVKNEPVTVRPKSPASTAIVRPAREISPEQMAAAAEGLKPAHLKVLNNLAELLAMTGATSISKEQLAAWSGYSPQGGGYNNNLGTLRSAGMLDYGGTGVQLTEEGRKMAQPTDVDVTNAAMLDRAKGVLKPAEAKIFDPIHAAYPEVIAKEDLAARTGYEPRGGGFNNNLGHMRTLGFITYQNGGCRAADWLFVESSQAASA